MPRTARQAPREMIFHVLNRGNVKDRIFDDDADYAAFERVLAETQLEVSVRIPSSVVRRRPFGSESWQEATAKQLNPEFTFRPRERPRKAIDPQ